ncbi:MAG: DNA translocase FtsK [Bacteriovoracia bacterium]
MQRKPISRNIVKPYPRTSVAASRGVGAPPKRMAIEILSLLCLALAVFSICALVTYNPRDPSFFTNTHQAATNACGWVGAYLASLLLQSIGLGGFLLPAALIFLATTVHQREGFVRATGIMGGMCVAVVSFSVFLTLQWPTIPYAGGSILTGGVFGAWVAKSLEEPLHPLGASIISLVVFFIAVVASTPVSVSVFLSKALRAAAFWTFRGAKLAAAYLVYLLGLFSLKLVQGAYQFIQKAAQAVIRLARERATAVGAEMKREAGKAKGAVSPEIGLEGAELEAAGADGVEVEALTDAEAVEISEIPEAGEFDDTDGTESEWDEEEIPSRGAKSGKAPEILPWKKESAQEPTAAEAAAAKRASKLASMLKLGAKKTAWQLPTTEFLSKPPKIDASIDRDRLIQNSAILRDKLADFGIEGEVTAVRPGPVITLYEFRPGPGIKVSRIAALADDLSMALSAESVRILAPLPGKSVVGIEIPSDNREKVFLREFLQHPDFRGERFSIPVVMGKDIGGQCMISDLARMPHLLSAGQTGSGKSVFMNGLICSLLYRFTPDELRLILVDPKFIEFRSYADIPHLLLPVVDDPKHASIALKWAVREMERRYRILAAMGARNLAAYNQKVQDMGVEVVRDLLSAQDSQASGSGGSTGPAGDWLEAFEPDETGTPQVGKLPYIVVIIDELADLMMVARKEVEISIARIAQKARAAGIHLVIATQRPSTDVITGLIKANLPSRVSFQLASHIDSKTILDKGGAERLLGQGDMLFIPPGTAQMTRLHGAFVDDDEINKITAFLKEQGKPVYRDEILIDDEADAEGGGDEEADPLFQDAVELVKRTGQASASFLQRHLKVGYNRAARMIETMEEKGMVGPADGARPREVLIR